MAEYSINAKITGILQDTHFLDKWQDHPDVLYARPLVEVCSCSKMHSDGNVRSMVSHQLNIS
jgi:hypothetical protein